ncbi:molybdenum cofactor guanylyltransferase [Pseudoxanthomonas sp. LH2527]|uniref:molybdenum cofactor guanylyltransferase n=1 Tax=Pseudoxanthomonas sp. LH2527 TaxID=2923249 RepID=UPI002402D106|nr:molybdenum cofactor guanylyltransferase [Pseudoxanthomonas sp. LH2527]
MPAWRAVLLAGGRSSRMGTDKALLPWGDGTLLTHMPALLRAAGACEVIVSGDRPGFDSVPDAQPDTGPMGALAQLAPRLRDGAWIVVPVDMPLLSIELLHALLATDAACTCVEGHALPMALRLDADVRATLEQIGGLTGRACSLRALQQRLHTVHLPSSPWKQVLRNCNTPEDWAALQHPTS